jgi:hypothetical protein
MLLTMTLMTDTTMDTISLPVGLLLPLSQIPKLLKPNKAHYKVIKTNGMM